MTNMRSVAVRSWSVVGRNAKVRLAVMVLLCACGTTLAHAQELAFGGIELASSSVKGLTFTFQPGADASLNKPATNARPERMKRLQYAERNATFISMRDGCKLSDKGMDLLLADVKEVVNELREGAKAKNLGELQLYAVGSSGLGAVCNRTEILQRVQAETGMCMEFISAADESRYSLGFVLPRDRYRSMVLDIGGGNTKAGYYVITKGAAWPPHEWHGLELGYGSRTLRDEALALTRVARTDATGKPLPAFDFYQAVDEVLRTRVAPRLEEWKLTNSAIANFNQVYLVGGAVWATSTREKPVQQQEWAISSLNNADFDAVLRAVRNGTVGAYDDGQFNDRVSRKTRDDATAELQQVLQRFDPQSLYAGVRLTQYVVEQTTPAARLYFPTTAAWISGYAREKFRETGYSVRNCTAPADSTSRSKNSIPVEVH